MDEGSLRSRFKEQWQAFSREQRLSVVLLSVCGIVTLGFSYTHMTSLITEPFTVSRGKLQKAKFTLDQLNPDARLEAEAKRRDTDGDGLSDWDEEKSYRTSPYLRDTDGDGLLDNVELGQGTNPNCKEGTNCVGAALDTSKLVTSTLMGTPGADIKMMTPDETYAAFQEGANTGKQQLRQATGATSTELQDGLVRDPNVLRKALLDSGKVDEKVLDQLTDQQLLELYDQAASAAAAQQVDSATSTTSTSP